MQTGTISASMGASMIEFTGTKTSGHNGADAVVQWSLVDGGSTNNLTVTMNAFADPNNRPVAFFSHRYASGDPLYTNHDTAEGYTELHDASHDSVMMLDMTEWHATAANTTPSASWDDTGHDTGGFALEIAEALSTPPPIVYRSIGTNTGTLYNTGTASISNGSTTVTFSGGSLPEPDAVGAVGPGDVLVLGGETFYIKSRDSATQVTVQTAATGDRSGTPTITRAYNDFQTWENTQQGDLVGENRIEVGVAYKDGPFAPTAQTTIDDSTTDASHYMQLTVAPGQRHNGTAGTGVIVDGSSPLIAGNLFRVRDTYFKMEWLEIRNFWGTVSSGAISLTFVEPNRITRASGSFITDGFEIGNTITTDSAITANKGPFTVTNVTALEITVSQTVVVNEGPVTKTVTKTGGQPINVNEGYAGNNLFSHLIIHDYTSTGRGAINVYENATIRNCIFYNGDKAIRSYSNDNLTLTIENCTVYNMTDINVDHQAGKLIVKNTISVGSGNNRDFDLDNDAPVDGSSGYNMYSGVHNDIHPGPSSGLISISFDGPTKTITRSTGSFVGDGFVVGNIIRTDSASNPGPFTITNVTSLVITVSEAVTTVPATLRNVYLDVSSVIRQSPPASLEDLFISIVASSEDLHLESSGHNALDNGTDLSASFTDDIDGETRPTGANTWDIGADEVLPSPLYRSVGTNGNNLNTDSRTVEISGSTANFAGDMPNNVGVGDVLTYNSGGNQLAFIHGRTSSTVFTVKDKDGNSPTVFTVKDKDGNTPTAASAGTSVGVYRAYTSLDNCFETPNQRKMMSTPRWISSLPAPS
jgi:hypothetical protein